MRSVAVRLWFVSSLLFWGSIVSPASRAANAAPPPVPATAQTTPAPPVPATTIAPASQPMNSTVPATAPSSRNAAAPGGRRFAIELSTGGLSSLEDAAIGLGWGSDRVAGGLSIAFRYSSLTGPSQGEATAELTETTMAVGPWLRFDVARWLADRAALEFALDVQYTRQSVGMKVDTNPARADGAANGVTARLGPGIRFWVTPGVAVGYTTQLSLIGLSGPLVAFSQSTTLGSSTSQFDEIQVALVGRFSVLALF
jgi:hypothetical protein